MKLFLYFISVHSGLKSTPSINPTNNEAQIINSETIGCTFVAVFKPTSRQNSTTKWAVIESDINILKENGIHQLITEQQENKIKQLHNEFKNKCN